MKKLKFTTIQIAVILKEFEQGKSADELVREYGYSNATFYKWRQRYGGSDIEELI
ncbi:MAG: hypothetical protein RL660_1752 [Bacteroidota bacterium]|jgi:putative transposase